MAKKTPEDFVDKQAERAVLAGICQYGGDSFVDVEDLIDANAFKSSDYNTLIYKGLQYHFREGLDHKVDVPSILSGSPALNTPDGMRYLRGLFNYPIEKETVRREAQRLFKLQITEQLDEIAAQVRHDLRCVTGDEPLSNITSILETPIFEYVGRLNQAGADGPGHISLGVDEFLDDLENNPRDNIGISSGLEKYDFYIGGGFRRATVSIVGARMKVGKTILCDNIALHIAGNLKIPVLNLDTEMTRNEHLVRILSYVCGTRFNTEVTIREIETGRFGQNSIKRKAVREAAEWIKSIPYDYDSVVDKSFEEQVATMRRWVRKNVGVDETGRTNDCMVIYDYLQPPEPGEFGENAKEHQILGYQMLSLLRTAAKCDIPIFTLVQLNRDGIDKESTGVAADSDRPLRKAANFTILKWKSEEEMAEDGEEAGTHKLVPIIARHGEAMAKGDYINLKFDGRTARITEGPTRNELAQGKKTEKGTIRKTKPLEYDEPKSENGKIPNPPEDIGF